MDGPENRRSRANGQPKLDSLEPNWPVVNLAERSFATKWTVRDDSGRSWTVKLDGNSTKSGRFEEIKL